MFREMSRKKQQTDVSKCCEILKTEPRGILSVNGDDGYPYAVPMNFLFDEKENKIYFHGGKKGHKMDAISKCDKVCFCVYDKGFHKDGHWSLNITSVVVFGRIKVVPNTAEVMEKIVELSKKYTQDMEYIMNEVKQFADMTACLELTIEHMTGKLVNES